MEPMQLNLAGVLDYQRNRPPYLMIDAAEVFPGVSASAYKDLPADTWFFAPHFEGDPLMPGMLQIEALVQTAALAITTLPGNKGVICYLARAGAIELKRRVIPGDRLELSTRIVSFRRGIARCAGEGRVNHELACAAEFTVVVPSILQELKPA